MDINLDSNLLETEEKPGAKSTIERGPGFYSKLGRGDVTHVLDAKISDQSHLSW
jgi:hypothetical protein